MENTTPVTYIADRPWDGTRYEITAKSIKSAKTEATKLLGGEIELYTKDFTMVGLRHRDRWVK
jgi:hypothetical protein